MFNYSIRRVSIIIGHFFFLMLFMLAILYSKERVVFIDTVYQFFKIVNFGKFNIEAGRYSAFLTQIPLILGIKTQLSLRSLLMIYSISFILVYYLVFILCVHVFKNITAGLSIIFIFLLCIKQSFFHSSTETHQGLVYTALLYAILSYPFKPDRYVIRYLFIGIAVLLSFYSHPVTFFTILFVTGLYMVDQARWKDKGAYFTIAFITLLMVLKLVFTPKDSYEAGFFSEIFNFLKSGTDIRQLTGWIFLKNGYRELYSWLSLFFLFTLIIQIIRKEYLLFIYTLSTSLLFLIITLITYNKGDAIVMMERAFMPLTIFVMIPFLKGEIQRTNKIITPIFALLIIFSLLSGVRRVHFEGQRFKKKYSYTEKLIEKADTMHGSKFLMEKSDNPELDFFLWTFPYTTMVISSMEGNDATKTIFLTDDLSKYEIYLTDKTNIYLGEPFWLEHAVYRLNHQYFRLPEEPYQLLE